MFGYAAFAQAPFSTLPVTGETYTVNILEAFTAEDFFSALRIHNADATEIISSITDLEAVIAAFSSSISESLTAADSAAASIAFYGEVAESITLNDSNTTILVYNVSAAEQINVADVTQCFGWGTIDNSESTVWTLIDNRQ
jgi:hypothetical protein